MRDKLDEMLRAEASRFSRTLQPRPVSEVLARGDQRRRRAMAATALLTAAVLTGSGAGAYGLARSPGGHPGQPVTSVSPTVAPGLTRPAPSPTASPRSSGKPARHAAGTPGIVGVTSAGALVVIDPATGTTIRTLVPRGVFPDEISVSRAGTVYYAAASGCQAEIYSVPVTGGSSTRITTGEQPAVSPDGTSLAFVREPFASGGQPGYEHCGHASNAVDLAIRNLATGVQRDYGRPPALSSALVYPISHLSWSPAGSRLAVSFGQMQDNGGWNLVLLDPATAKWYITRRTTQPGQVPVQGAKQGFYYREGVYLPNGDLLVSRVCCSGVPVHTTSSLIDEVSPAGTVVRQVAIGYTNRDHSSLDAYGRWVLYLSGNDLLVSKNGQRPAVLTTGLVAAAWVPSAS